MKMILQPSDGVAPILSAIKRAKKSIEIAIFRFDYNAIEIELRAAVKRGVKVTALIASVNRGGAERLRQLELRFLAAGITVGRTSSDLNRYHDKFIIIDREMLYVLSFNFTHLDIDHSRGFGIVTKNAKWLQEAVALFEADRLRTKFTPASDLFVVSPANARKVLAAFLKRARRQLLIYDPKISDKEMLALLRDRAKAQVEIRVIGKVRADFTMEARKLAPLRLHTRTIIRDSKVVFVGSQSLRASELDSRRELGVIVRDRKTVKMLTDTFELDWKNSAPGAPKRRGPEKAKQEDDAEARDVPETVEVAEVLADQLDPLTSALKESVKQAVTAAGTDAITEKKVKATVKKVVKRAVKEAIQEVVHEPA